MTTPTPTPAGTLPEPFGPYTLIRRLGKGGIGEVYLGIAKTARGERKLLAVKRLLPSYSSDPELVSMLADEARLAVWLKHPNIVQVFDFGHVAGAHCIAMEFVDGCDLSALIRGARGSQARGQPLPAPTALFVMLRIAEALEHAHRCRDAEGRPLRIIHRDVSPHNVLLSRTGEVKLTDFGLARTEISSHKTRAGVVRGKFCYMPKEQAHGQVIDHRIDVFAAGVTLYEALTGTRPYTSLNLAQQLYQLEQPVPPPSTHVREIPGMVDEIVMRAMQPDAASRYQHARELARDLRRALLASSSLNAERARVAELVQRALPRQAATVESLPRLSLEELPPPSFSLIPDDVAAARRTIIALSQSALETAYSVEAELEQAPPPPGDASTAATLARPPADVPPPAPGRATDPERGRHASAPEDLPPTLVDRPAPPAPSNRTPPPALERPSAAREARAEAPLRREARGRATGGTIENSQVLAKRIAAGTPSGGLRPPEPTPAAERAPAAAPGHGLVAALRKAQGGGRRGTSEALSAFEHALAERRRGSDPEYDHETLFVRPRAAAPIARMAIALLAVALLGLGLVTGWLLRDRLRTDGTDEPEARRAAERGGGSVQPLPWPPPSDPSGQPGLAPSASAQPPVSRARKRRRSATSAAKAASRPIRSRPDGRKSRTAGRKSLARRGTTTPVPPGGGALSVHSERPGTVLINDQPAGTTPARLGLEAGIYRVKLRFEDNSESPVKFVTIDEGSKAQLSF